jgi:low affinity Fe/Cu permease
MVMNTLTSIITFLMVFLIQIRMSTAKNLFLGLERLSPDEIEEIRRTVHGHLERRSTSGS